MIICERNRIQLLGNLTRILSVDVTERLFTKPGTSIYNVDLTRMIQMNLA